MKKITLTLLPFLVLPAIMVAADFAPIYNPVAESFGKDATIGDLLKTVLRAVTYIAIPIIALAFIWSGFKFVKAQGESAGITNAKETLWYTILGTAVVLGANLILEVVVETTKSLGIG
jgi:hypothetical protein